MISDNAKNTKNISCQARPAITTKHSGKLITDELQVQPLDLLCCPEFKLASEPNQWTHILIACLSSPGTMHYTDIVAVEGNEFSSVWPSSVLKHPSPSEVVLPVLQELH